MRVDLIIEEDLRVYNVATATALGGRLKGKVDAAVGREVKLVLIDPPPGPLRWSADNDEVLTITDDGGPQATIKAEHSGASLLEIIQQGRVLCVIAFEVSATSANRLVPTVGTPEQQ